MRISTSRSNSLKSEYLVLKARYLGFLLPVIFLLMNFQTVYSQLSVTASVTSEITCHGVLDGEITAVADMGTPSYTYEWSDGQTDATATGLGVGTYSVTVTDNLLATANVSVVLTEPAVLFVNLSPTDYNGYAISQFGGSDGGILTAVLGGTGAYTYSWSNGASTADVSGLTEGLYCVAVTDANNCSVNACATLVEPATLVLSLDAVVDAKCNSEASGEIHVTVTGGVFPFSFAWSSGHSTEDLLNIPTGTYFLTVVDANGATTILSNLFVDQPDPLEGSLFDTDILCYGDDDGSIDVYANGGIPPYEFRWYRQANLNLPLDSTAGYSSTFGGLDPDNYCVVIEDANECIITRCVGITSPPELIAVTDSVSQYNGFNISCFGAQDGWANISVIGGVPPYNYAWGNNYATTQDNVNMFAGPWGVDVYDDNGCDFVLQGELIQPDPIIANVTIDSDVSCFGLSDGAASAVVSGGAGNLLINWNYNGSFYDTGDTITNLFAGTYCITVEDDVTNCHVTDVLYPTNTPPASWDYVLTGYNHTVLVPTAFVNISGDPLELGDYLGVFFDNGTDPDGCAGYAQVMGDTTIIVVWGDDNLTIIKDGMDNNETFVWRIFRPYIGEFTTDAPNYNLGGDPGFYVTGNMSLITSLISPNLLPSSLVCGDVTEPDVLEISVYSLTDASCYGFTDGAINITVIGGTMPYTYDWFDGANSFTTEDLDLIPAGTYDVTVTDDHGCMTSATYIISEPTELTLTLDNSVNVLCFGGDDGAIMITVAGGTTPYTYSWSNGEVTDDIYSLEAGTYDVDILDAQGCMISGSYTITEPDLLEISNYSITDVTCNGFSNGAVDIDVIGGTTAYTFGWSNGTAMEDLNNVVAGTYTVDIMDAHGCTTSGTYTITEPDTIAISSVLSNYNGYNISCPGDADGSITNTVTGGTTSYTYEWATGETTLDLDNLPAGTYTLSVTDANGCVFVETYILTEPATSVSLTLTKTDVSCFGFNDGTVTSTVIGGLPPYTYLWATGETTADLMDLYAGTYDVSVYDINNCVATGSITVDEPTELVFSASASTSIYGAFNISCFGEVDGYIFTYVAGGTTPYSYLWSNGAITPSITMIGAGTYSVIVTDDNGCVINDTITLIEPDQIYINTTATPVSCNGGKDGTATVTVTGGTGTYAYLWSNGVTDATINNLVAGVYTVVVTDDNNCVSNNGTTNVLPWNYSITGVNHTILIPDTINALIGGTPLQNGDFIGVFYDDAGTLVCAGYTEYVGGETTVVAWGDDTQTSPKDGFLAGDVFVWKLWRPFVDQFDVPATYLPVGGILTQTDTYADWGMSGIASLVDNSDLTVIDVSGAEVTEPDILVVTSITSGTIQCAGGTTDVATTVAGGTMPYGYLWATGEITSTLTGVIAGTYDVTVTDANNCTADASITIIDPPTLFAYHTFTDCICFGDNTGTAALNITGGYPPYTIDWNGFNPNALIAGTYSATITDDEGCTFVVNNIVIGQPDELIVTGVETPTLCNGSSDGSIDITVTGGSTPYTYLWSTGATTEDISGLAAGSYDVLVEDAHGCVANLTVTVTEPTPVSVTGTIYDYNGYNVSCYGDSDGSITITPDGGMPGYTFLWSNGAVTQNIDNLAVGTYDVTVTDVHYCTATASFTLIQADPIAISIAIDSTYTIGGMPYSTSCNGSDGYISSLVTGGAGTFTYAWSYGQTTADLDGVVAGVYEVTVTDINGCEAISNIVVLNTPGPQDVVAGADTLYNGYEIRCNGGQAAIFVTWENGGVAPYDLWWSDWNVNNVYNVADTFYTSGEHFYAGTYWVEVKDASGCGMLSNVFTFTEPDPIVAAPGISNVSCFGGNDGSFDLSLTTGGVSPYSFMWDPAANNSTDPVLSGLSAGDSHYYVIYDQNDCNEGEWFTVTEPELLVIDSVDVTDALCFGDNTGIITPYVVGGTAPYIYSIDGVTFFNVLDDIFAGTYTLTVKDDNDCSTTVSVTVGEPALLEAYGVVTDATCFGDNNGSIDLFVSGGTASYSFIWSDGFTSEDNINLLAGHYDVTVTDAHGCEVILGFDVNEPTELVASTTGTDPLCVGSADGTISLTVVGGSPSYTYAWSNGATTDNLSGLVAGTYDVTVTDTHNCIANASYTLVDPDVFVVSGSVTNVSCNGGDNGAIVLSVSGATPTYSFLWSNGAITQDISTLVAGTYDVDITDANNCIESVSFVVEQPVALGVTYTVVDASCFGYADGTVEAIVTGGTTPYTYTWSVAGSTETVIDLSEGTYDVTITDANNCELVSSAYVGEPTEIDIAYDVTDVSCFGGDDGEIDLTITDPFGSFTFNWDIGDITEEISGLSEGSYDVTVTNTNGCFAVATIDVNEPVELTATVTGYNVVCNGAGDGYAEVVATDGTSPYTYIWSNNETTDVIYNLVPGTYAVTITDYNGCTFEDSTLIEEADELVLDLVATNVVCNNDVDGSIDLAITGGATPFTFLWSDMAHTTTQNISGLAAGTYTVTVTDGNGCIAIESADIIVTDLFEIQSISITDPLCNEGDDGSIYVEMTIGHFNYVWTNLNNDTIATLINSTFTTVSDLIAGDYYLEISRPLFSSCIMNETYTVGEPDAIDLSTIVDDASCYKLGDGEIDLTVMGGTSPYNYQWTNGANIVGLNEDLANRKAGIYKVVVIDDHACTAIKIDTIAQPTLLTSSINTLDVTCNGYNNGSVFLVATGGTAAYSYSWSNFETGDNLTNLAPGTYLVTVTDNNGCETNTFAEIFEPAALDVTVVGVNLACFDDGNGAAHAEVLGGTFPYGFEWTNSVTNDFIDNVDAGWYQVTVTDANLCFLTGDITLTQPDALTLDITLNTGNTLATANVTGGTPAYSYLWSNGFTFAQTPVASGTTYTVTVTDDNGCTIDGSKAVTSAPTFTGNDNGNVEDFEMNTELANEIVIYPNPSSDGIFVIDLGQISIDNAQLQVVDAFGKVVNNKLVKGKFNNQIGIQLQAAQGVYYLRIITDNYGSITKPLVITE